MNKLLIYGELYISILKGQLENNASLKENVKAMFKKQFDSGDLTELRYVMAVRWENMRVPGKNEKDEVSKCPSKAEVARRWSHPDLITMRFLFLSFVTFIVICNWNFSAYGWA